MFKLIYFVNYTLQFQIEICHNSTRFFKRKRRGHQQKHVHTGTTLRIINNPALGNKLQGKHSVSY